MGRLHTALLRKGVDSRILCLKSRTPSDDSFEMEKSRLLSRTEGLLHRFTSRAGLNDLHSISSFGIKNLRDVVDADVIDLHAIHFGTFNYLALPGLAARKPVVFSLHDMWAITGHCHASWDCERWKTGCGKCPHPEIVPSISHDTSRIEWSLKRYAYRRAPMTMVCANAWMEGNLRESMLRNHQVARIPWGVDTDVYRPANAAACRQALNIPPEKKVVLFSVADSGRRFLKGGDLLQALLPRIPQRLRDDLILLFFGEGGHALTASGGLRVIDLGYIGGDRLKAMAYSAADLFVLPTRADNSPCTVLESMACGTPVVSFRVGGVPEMVRPGETGWLAPPEDAAAMAAQLSQALENDAARRSMGEQCRQFAVAEHSMDVYAERYLDVYRATRDRFAGQSAEPRSSEPAATVNPPLPIDEEISLSSSRRGVAVPGDFTEA